MKAANLTGWTPDWMDTLYTIYDTISFKLSIIGGMRCDKKDGFLVAPVHVLADIRRIRRPVRQELGVFGSTANWRLVKEEQAAGKNPHRRDSLTPHKTTPPPHQERHKKHAQERTSFRGRKPRGDLMDLCGIFIIFVRSLVSGEKISDIV